MRNNLARNMAWITGLLLSAAAAVNVVEATGRIGLTGAHEAPKQVHGTIRRMLMDCSLSNDTMHSVSECLTYFRCRALRDTAAAAARPATSLVREEHLLTMYGDGYVELVHKHWFPSARSLGYPAAAALHYKPKPAISHMYGGPGGAWICPVDVTRGAPPGAADFHVANDVGTTKVALTWHGLTCGRVVMFSEADVLLLQDPMETPLVTWDDETVKPKFFLGAVGTAVVPRGWSGDLLISGHHTSPRVNIGMFIAFRSDPMLQALADYIKTFSDRRRVESDLFDQAFFDGLLGKYDVGMPGLVPWSRRDMGLTWAAMSPSQYLEYDGDSCDSHKKVGCWGGPLHGCTTVTVHFTCMALDNKLANLQQLYETGTCDRCGEC